ncbi:MAG TPA: TetR/AcrR family transcriptional regulator [Micromonosporaceae bacterium]|nr:TetR/AcrR family transcriptional regulator [Micromonosporaceae bacterium]
MRPVTASVPDSEPETPAGTARHPAQMFADAAGELAARRRAEAARASRRRVAPLSPEDRRAALIEATIPLLRTHGLAVSTRQIAEAAGVAEGTIFRVFPDKTSLVVATILAATDPAQDIAALAAIDPDADLRSRLRQITTLMLRRLRENMRLHVLAREMIMNPSTTHDIGVALHQRRQHIVDALADALTPDAAGLRVSPRLAARLLLSMVAASSHMFDDGNDSPDGDQIVAVLLDGLLAGPRTPSENRC